MPRHTHPTPVRKHPRRHVRRQARRWQAKRLAAARATIGDLQSNWRNGRALAGRLADGAPWWLYRPCRCCSCCVFPDDPRRRRIQRRLLAAEIAQGLADFQEGEL